MIRRHVGFGLGPRSPERLPANARVVSAAAAEIYTRLGQTQCAVVSSPHFIGNRVVLTLIRPETNVTNLIAAPLFEGGLMAAWTAI
jgi:hypothetical protein